MIEDRPLFLIKNKGFIARHYCRSGSAGALVLSLTGPGLPTHPRLLSAPRVRQWMSVIERCHFVAYSFVFPVLSSLSAMRCIVAARRPHSSTPTLQNTNNQEDPSIPRLRLVDSRIPTLSLFKPTWSLSLVRRRRSAKQPASIEPPRDILYSSWWFSSDLYIISRCDWIQCYCLWRRICWVIYIAE